MNKTFRACIISAAIGCITALAAAANWPVMNPKDVIAKYGKPDSVRNAEFEKPRPPIVTQAMEYKRAGASVLLLADAPIGSPPPYKQWKLMGYQDAKTGGKISPAEFESRLNAKK